MMNDYEFDETLRYNEYLAEQEYLDRLSDIAYMAMLNEADIAETKQNIINAVKDYIKKVINGIDLAFKNLTARIQEKGWETFKKNNIESLEKDRPINITNGTDKDLFPVFNEIDQFVESETAQITDINTFAEEDQTETEFLKTKFKYFSNINMENYNAGEVSKNVMERCFEPLSKVNGGQAIEIGKGGNVYGKVSGNLDHYIDYLDNFKNKADQINKDIAEIKQTSNAFNNLISRIQSSTAPEETQTAAPAQQTGEGNQQAQEAALMMYNEAVSFVNYLIEFQSEDAADPEGEATKKAGGSPERNIQKQINKYFRVTTSILSLKMKVVNRAYAISFNVCNRYARNAKKY